ncbi:MAG TPA: sugar phosphate isomerase/epimerase family protein [Chloroflexota bacterium]|nr:sugar phosphate isomerase/epimerase family protein [Chloroflexota bacterium]
MQRLQLGIMTRHVERGSIEEVAGAVAGHGLEVVQLSLESAGLEPLPERLSEREARRIAGVFRDAGVRIAAVSGTFNVIDPDRAALAENMERFARLCDACGWLETRVVTTCTGTRNPDSMWRPHPGNQLPDAWDELLERTGQMARAAERAGVVMAFEPETANVVDTLEKAERLIAAVGSKAVGVTFDPANFFYPADLPRMGDVLREGFRRLGRRIALAHAKDVVAPPEGGSHCRYAPAGRGVLDYGLYLRLLRESGYENGLIMHSLSEADLPGCVAMIRERENGAA